VDEFEIIRRYFEPKTRNDSVIVGVGDDGAILRPEPGRDLVTVIDSLVAGVHFPESLAPADIGYRSVAVNVSDVAAMGGRPRWMTLALTLVDADPRWLEEFARGLYAAGAEYGVDLVGGDTTRGSELVVSVQVFGDIGPENVLTRSGARAGDGIYVTGTPGYAAAGLSILQSGAHRSDAVDYLIGRFARPSARVAVGRGIAPFATAAIDLSDGLYTDLEKLLAASCMAGSIEIDAIPLSPQLASLMSADNALRFALGGGDDYELCFTASSDDACREIANQCGVPITRIGEILKGDRLSCTRGGGEYDYQDDGYRHFS